MKLHTFLAGALAPILILASWVFAQQPYGSIQRLNPKLSGIIAPRTKVNRLATGFKWVEGPVWILSPGFLLFADTPSSIRKWQQTRGVSMFLQPRGANGMTLGPQGRLTVAGDATRDVYRFETMNPHGQITILADSYQGKRLNSPNDLVYRTADGSLYFTDPPYGLPTHSDHDPLKQLPFNGVYRLPGAAQIMPGSAPEKAALQLLIKDLPRPNGIAFSQDERYLYVDNSEPKKIWKRYPVNPDGSLGKGTLFYDATSDNSPGGPDGMKVDRRGNIYSAGPGGLWIFTSDGTHLGTIRLKERVSNCAWGDPDWKTLYITANSSIYSIRVKIPGIHP